jgi:Holliday junction resolvase RusA-like endonuclease
MEAAIWKIMSQREMWHKMEGALRMYVDFYMLIPSSLSKIKQKNLEGKPHKKKPDLSNLIKFVEDVMNGLVYDDDRQIVEIIATKSWSYDPRTFIKLVTYEQKR